MLARYALLISTLIKKVVINAASSPLDSSFKPQ